MISVIKINKIFLQNFPDLSTKCKDVLINNGSGHHLHPYSTKLDSTLKCSSHYIHCH